MARVVPKKASPPYLLVVFAFLFVLAAGAAVILYLRADEVRVQLKDTQDALNNLGTEEERHAAIQSPVAVSPGGETQEKAITLMKNAIAALAEDIAGPRAAAETALGKAAGLRDAKTSPLVARYVPNMPLAAALARACELLDGKDQEIARLNADVQSRIDAMAESQKQITAVSETNLKAQRDWDAERQKLSNESTRAAADFNAKLEKIARDNKQTETELLEKIENLNARILDLTASLQDKDNAIAAKDRVIAQMKIDMSGPKKDPTVVGPKPDGKIIRLLEKSDMVYINIGSDNGVRPGLTFSVFDPAGIPESGDGAKATIEVITATANASECRIVSRKADSSLVAGDLVCNIAFDTVRTYSFMIQGLFDLHGEGLATSQGAEELKGMIERSGGKVVKDIQGRPDYIVLGEEPPAPAQPTDASVQINDAVYQAQLDAYKRHKEVQDAAAKMSIPVLTLNRFMALSGLEAVKAAK